MGQAASSGFTIDLEDLGHDHVTVIIILVCYLYHDIYPCFNEACTDGILAYQRFYQPARVFSLARVYNLPGLQELARKRFENAITHEYDDELLLQCLHLVYGSDSESDRSLRDLVVSALVPRLPDMIEETGTRGFLATLFRQHPELGTDLLATKASIQVPEAAISTAKTVVVDVPWALGEE